MLSVMVADPGQHKRKPLVRRRRYSIVSANAMRLRSMRDVTECDQQNGLTREETGPSTIGGSAIRQIPLPRPKVYSTLFSLFS